MAITITTDPLVTEDTVRDILGWDGDEARLAINSVSARFLKYTGRDRINSGAITDEIHPLPPYGCPKIWLRAAPVDTGETFTVEIYEDGSLSSTVASGDYTLYAATGKVVLESYGVMYPVHSRDIRVTYTGGWTSVPGDLVESGIQLMVLDRQRRDGSVGVQGMSREGESTTYQTSDLPQSVRQVWDRYRIF